MSLIHLMTLTHLEKTRGAGLSRSLRPSRPERHPPVSLYWSAGRSAKWLTHALTHTKSPRWDLRRTKSHRGDLNPFLGFFLKQQQSHVTYIIPISGQLFGKIKKEKKCFGGRFDLMTGCRGYRERERKGWPTGQVNEYWLESDHRDPSGVWGQPPIIKARPSQTVENDTVSHDSANNFFFWFFQKIMWIFGKILKACVEHGRNHLC